MLNFLKDKQGLNVLSMEWSNILNNFRNGNVESRVIEMLEPHKKLKELSIIGYGGFTFPNWVGNSLFSNMVCLKFQNCEKCTSLPPLGQLPSLAKLYIQGMKAVGNVGLEFYGLGRLNPFPALVILSFDDMPEWKDWSTPFGVEEGAQAFARLSELSIKRCPKLSHELPRNLPRLRNLDIKECPVLVVAWIPSPPELNEVRNTLHFDSLVSLHLKDVSIADSLGSSEVSDQVVLKNSSHSLLSSLTSLKLKNIRGHKCLPSWVFQGLTGLQEFSLHGVEELTTFWEDEVRLQNRLPALRRLTIEDCPHLISLFAGGEGDDLKSLQTLFISRCPRLTSFPVLPSTLKMLCIGYCDRLVSLPDLTLLNNLENLNLWECPSLTYLSAGTGLPPALKELMVDRCAELKSLIAEEGIKINCPSLESVNISDCDRLKTLPDVMQNNGLRNLSQLRIWNCENLESLPEGWFPTTNLREFDIALSKKFKPLPNHEYNNNNLASLEKLCLMGSSPVPTGLLSHILDEGSSSYFTNLTELTTYHVDIGKLCGLHRLHSLRKLTLFNCDWVSFPEGWMFPSSLVVLDIENFPNLEKLSFKDLENLVSLEQLYIWNCHKLTTISELGRLPSLSDLKLSRCSNFASFPEQGLPPSLLYLKINKCPMLNRRCEKGKGKYWGFIAHIPEVIIDKRFVFDPSS